MSISYCKVCGFPYEDDNCRNIKAHTKIDKLISLYGDLVYRILMKNEEVKNNAYAIINSKDSTDTDLMNSYKVLVMAYYIRFQQYEVWESSITFESYWGMLLNSCPDKFSAHPNLHKEFIDKYGLVYGLAKGKTYVMVEDSMRYIENSLFRAYTSSNKGWIIVNKTDNRELFVEFNKLKRTETEDYVMTYVRCLARINGWI